MPDLFPQVPLDLPVPLLTGLTRLVAAAILGGVVAGVYRLTRPGSEVTQAFLRTLVLLAIMIAMVTQVVGNNAARAFSLVGALSIVRFRTVVRDIEDTAFVIFAVAIGMAAGASQPELALIGLAVVLVTAILMRGRKARTPDALAWFRLSVRVGLGHDAETLIGGTLDKFASDRRVHVHGDRATGHVDRHHLRDAPEKRQQPRTSSSRPSIGSRAFRAWSCSGEQTSKHKTRA